MLTVVVVAALLCVVALVTTVDLTALGGSDDSASEAAPPATSSSSSSASADDTRAPATDDPGDRLPPRERRESDPTSQAQPPALPTLAELDRTMRRKGLVRVGGDAVDGLEFTAASFNVLGASHTRGPNGRKGYAIAERRLGPQLSIMESKGIEIAGMQEFQQDQVRALGRQGRDWAIFPGLELGTRLADNSIMWRDSLWERVRTQTTPVPYFGGNPVPMPQVLLEHRETGRRVWVANFHNPADSRGNAAAFRQRALEIEADLALRLGEDGTPVLLTGDMNDRAEFACPFSRLSGMVSADGAATRNGRCVLPQDMFVDWIFGNDALAFSDFEADRSVERDRLSDHPLISSTVTLPGVRDTPGCRTRIVRRGQVWYCPA